MATKNENEIKDQKRYGQRLTLQEYFVDFLGGLVPGVLFLTAAILGTLNPLHSLGVSLSGDNREPFLNVLKQLFISIQNTPSAIWLILFAGATLLAYIVGHLFYRHDPKTPDKKSFQRLSKFYEQDHRSEIKMEAKNSNKKYEEILADALERNLACSTKEDCEFPYPQYHKYLKQRGFHYLERFVLWKVKKAKNLRSKAYINVLKIRLRHYFPEKCGTIIRNEAHVRLASSTWHVSGILLWFGGMGMLTAILAISISLRKSQFPDFWSAIAWHIFPLLVPLMVMVLSYYLRYTIQKFFHYQRLREVFFVLETAHTAFKAQPELLQPPFEKKENETEGS